MGEHEDDRDREERSEQGKGPKGGGAPEAGGELDAPVEPEGSPEEAIADDVMQVLAGKAPRWRPECDREYSVLVWNRRFVEDCRLIRLGEWIAMIHEISAKARRSVDALCSLNPSCTNARITRAVVDTWTCRNGQWDLTLRIFFRCER